MRTLGRLLVRVGLLLALIMALVPSWASETVCVMPHREPVPMATCGMPCCAKGHTARAVCVAVDPAPKPSCCPERKGAVSQAASRSAVDAPTSCRCETRVKSLTTPRTSLTQTVQHVAVAVLALPEPPAVLPVVEPEPSVEPGIIGSDSGPPTKPARSETPGRSPPTR